MSRGQRGKGRFAGLEKNSLGNSDGPSFLIQGGACTLFDDDSTARAMDAGKHLVPWHGAEDVLVDRYDARLLLDDAVMLDAAKEKSRTPQPLSGNSDDVESTMEESQLLDFERYADLDYSREHELENPLAVALLQASGKQHEVWLLSGTLSNRLSIVTDHPCLPNLLLNVIGQ